MKKFFTIIGLMSGIWFIIQAIGFFMASRAYDEQSKTLPTYDRELGALIYQESLARGDPEWMASFYRTDVECSGEDDRLTSHMTAVWGFCFVGVGCAILGAWATIFYTAVRVWHHR